MKPEVWYVHEFLVSSGKANKLITKTYKEQAVAYEQHKLLGGVLNVALIVNKRGTLT